MPLYEDLVRRALEAKQQAKGLQPATRRLVALSQILRDARAGKAMVVRCAWCDGFQLGYEWLHLEAIEPGQQLITEEVRAKASHGICPSCLEAVTQRAEEQRRARRRNR